MLTLSFDVSERQALPLLSRPVAIDRVAWLEGSNGIGKSLSVRVLELCTGRQPYARHPRAWQGMRDGLGPTAVTVSGLDGAASIRWTFDTREWPVDVPDAVDDSFFSITVDDRPSTLDEVQRLLSVHRIQGNEGLIETLAERIETDQSLMRSWRTRHTEGPDSTLGRVTAMIESATRLLEPLDPDLYTEFARQANEASELSETRRTDLREQTELTQRLEAAALLDRQLTELTDAGEDLDRRLEGLDAAFANADAAREKAQAEIAAIEDRAAVNAAVQRDLAKARALEVKREGRREKAARELAAKLTTGDIDSPDEAAVALTRTESELQELLRRRAAIDAGPRLRAAVEDVADRLRAAEDEGLGQQHLLAASGASLTVSAARRALGDRSEVLARETATDAGKELTRRIERVGEQARALRAVPRLRDQLARERELVEESRTEISRLLERTDEEAGAAIEELQNHLREIESTIREVTLDRATVRRQRDLMGGGRSADELESDLRQTLEGLQINRSEITDRLQGALRKAGELEGLVESTGQISQEAAARVVEWNERIRRASVAIAEGPEFAWLRYARPDDFPQPEEEPQRQMDMLVALRAHLERVAGRTGDLRRKAAGVEDGLEELAKAVRRTQPVELKTYAAALQTSLGEEYSGFFNEEAVRRALLPDAARATINLHDMSVDWVRADGQERSKPLEAFSSGQQALAYTRARLENIDLDDESGARNRLLVLDEFGAFVARDRVGDLVAMLREHRDKHKGDRMLIIVPAARDYEAELADFPDDEDPPPDLVDSARGIRAAGYFSREYDL